MAASKAGCQRDYGPDMSDSYAHLVECGDTMRSALLVTATSNAPRIPASIRLLMVSLYSIYAASGRDNGYRGDLTRTTSYPGRADTEVRTVQVHTTPVRREGLRPSPTTDSDDTLKWLAEPTRHEYNPPGMPRWNAAAADRTQEPTEVMT
jgi:hypothetical protein